MLPVALDERDVATAFDASHSNLGNIFELGAKAQVFLEVVSRDVIGAHGAQNELAVLHDYFGPALEETAEPMGMIRDECEKPMNENNDDAAAKCGKECGAPVDGTRENARENYDEDCIEGSLAGERSLMSQPDHEQRCDKDNNPAQRDLQERQISWIRV